MIEEALSATAMSVADLDVIAVTGGPGTFTGTRITTATARALALYAGTPLVTLSTLQLMAMNFAAEASRSEVLAVATDARRGEVYFEVFDPHTLRSLSGPAVRPVAEAANLLPAGQTSIAGSGAQLVADAALKMGKKAGALAPGLLPDAFDMLFVAMELPRFNTVEALYLRPPDAKPQINAALART